jgi:hypothetical protein
MENYIVKETNVWGDIYRARTSTSKLRLIEKQKILQEYPFIDHYKIYESKLLNQRGPARESQTFIVSYTYLYDDFIGDKEIEFIAKVASIHLRFYKERCVFRGKNAYKILIMDTDVDLNRVLGLLQPLI